MPALCIAISVALLAWLLPARPVGAAGEALVLAKYYAWFNADVFASGPLSDRPPEPYRSDDRKAIERHVAQARAAGVDGFALNWRGPDSDTDANLRTLLAVAGGGGFRVTVDVDVNMLSSSTPGALAYLRRYFADPAWVRYDGRPLVSFFGVRSLPVETWASIRASVDPNREALWLGEGDRFEYLDVFDGIHPYSVAWSPNPSAQLASYASRTRARPGKLWVATVMPGYDDTRLGRPDGFAVDRRAGAYYTELWRGAIATRPAFVMITSWNEWPEGSQIEPSRAYGDLYLRLTREMADAYRAGAAPAPVAAASAAPAAAPGEGAVFSEAGGGRGGFAITDRDGVAFWSGFRSLGGVDALGYPASRRFERGGFVYQATQGVVLQWRPELGQAVLANAFEWFTEAGKDGWLLEAAGIPPPIRDDGSGGDWQRARQIRLGWLTDEAIRERYLAAGSLERAIDLYGLPTSRPERRGPFVVQRFQRMAFQRWVDAVPGMPPPGSVVRVLGGDLLKQAGLIPPEAAQPT